MKKIIILALPLVFLIACSKGIQSQIEDNATNVQTITDLTKHVDLEITSQYSFYSNQSEFEGFRTTATFKEENPDAEVEVNGFTLTKNSKHPKYHRHMDDRYKMYHEIFKDRAGQSFPIKISKSSSIADLNTSLYIPKVSKAEARLNKSNNSLEVRWLVDENVNNNIMLVKLKFTNEIYVHNLEFDYKTGFAIIDFNQLKNPAPAQFDEVIIDCVYGTAKVVETSNNKKVRILTFISNRNIVSKEGN